MCLIFLYLHFSYSVSLFVHFSFCLYMLIHLSMFHILFSFSLSKFQHSFVTVKYLNLFLDFPLSSMTNVLNLFGRMISFWRYKLVCLTRLRTTLPNTIHSSREPTLSSSLYLYLSVSLSISPSSISLSDLLSVCLSFCLSVSFFLYVPVPLSRSVSVCSSVCPSVFVCPFISSVSISLPWYFSISIFLSV
jgi:hypothetical protein